MAENCLMTLDERLAIGIKCGSSRDEGKEDEAIALAKTRPMPAYAAKSSWENFIGARISCKPEIWQKRRLRAYP
jgi:hypothetical protein